MVNSFLYHKLAYLNDMDKNQQKTIIMSFSFLSLLHFGKANKIFKLLISEASIFIRIHNNSFLSTLSLRQYSQSYISMHEIFGLLI